MSFKKQEVQHAIENKLGLKPRVGKENNVHLKIGENYFIRITYPKGKGDLHPKTVHSIRRQTELGWDDFTDLIKCPLSAKEYENILLNRIKNKK